MKHTMSLLGIGGKLIIYTCLYAGIATLLAFIFPQIFVIRFVLEFNLHLFGYILLALGTPLLMMSVRQPSREFKEGILMTNGFYRYSRHPLYAVWIFFLSQVYLFSPPHGYFSVHPLWLTSCSSVLSKRKKNT